MKLTSNKHTTRLRAGDKAPLFNGINESGEDISLANLAGKKVVLFFYPQDDTPGCTTECCNLRDNFEVLRNHGFEIIGVSADNTHSHKKFIKKYSLPFNLIADETREIINAYDVWGLKKILGIPFTGVVRTTFIINENGIIEGVIDNVDTDNHASQILTLTKFYQTEL